MKSTAAWCGAVALLLAFACGEDEPIEQPHQTMREIFETIVVLLPAAVDPEGFAAPHSRDAIGSRLDLLAASAGSLREHTRAREATFAQLSRSLTRDIEASRALFSEGDYEQAREKLVGSIWNCVECHSLQRSARRFDMAERLLERVELEPLLPHERALLHVLARRMSGALAIWEALLVDPEVSPARLDGAGVFRDYLAVALRVEREPDRAARTLRAVAKRKDLPPHLAELLPRWVAALDDLAAEASAPPSLERARALAERADQLSTAPDDRSRLVVDLLGSSVLLEFVQNPDRSAVERAEAYLLLGEIEARGLGPLSAPKSELHLETAIRAQPKGPFAARAFELLVEQTAGPYGGISGPHLPDPVREQLSELRELMREAV